ncbi:hypothetical protein ACKGJO_06410 [Gracilimonas sp. Q87]|uniref:hypothetical protein n=1 Tax=Gracilimonas sp. Q87 TaxID=3384766 RepID=UPI003984169C
MKALITNLSKATGLILTSALIFSACSLGDVSSELNNNELTPEEMEAASQIMGEALSDDNDGVFSSLNDALATVSSDGFSQENTSFKNDDDDDDYSGRGNERNFNYEYDPATGTHTLSFDRSVVKPNFEKNISALLTYIFTDIDDQFIAMPRVNKDRIENIEFTANRNGDKTSNFRSSDFSRADTFAITGVSDATSILTLDGKHTGNGSITGVRGNGDTFERSFVNEINLLDVQINKDTVAYYGSLEQGVTGTLTYEMSLYKNNNGDESTKTVSGTIEMDGDGTALLRFENLAKIFKVNLQTGIVTDDEDDLEAMVSEIDTVERTVLLSNDILVIITGRTEVEGDEGIETLEEVAVALEAGTVVYAEVEGYISPQDQTRFIADEIEFEYENDDSDDDDNDDDN